MQSKTSFVVTIDGPAGAGKSTVARQLATRLGYAFLDTGAIYRGVALAARRAKISWSDGPALGALAGRLDIRFGGEEGVNRLFVDGLDVTRDIRTPEISEGASQVSALPEVRAALLGLQRSIAAKDRVVAEGRDTGTVVFPNAEAKFFLTAPPEERARRRSRELAAAGRPVDQATVQREMELRDARDSSRAFAPLKKAEDALEIDSLGLSPEEVVERMAAAVHERGG
jgi:cytidylate kinase